MRRKLEYILEAIDGGKTFIHSDSDVQFFRPFYDDILACLGSADVAFQCDGPNTCCAGFFICKSNDRTKHLFSTALSRLPRYAHDQAAINDLRGCVNWTMLPSDKYFTIGSTAGWTPWNIGDPVRVPSGVLLHHGNCTVGVLNKLDLMSRVAQAVKLSDPSPKCRV